jgi:hypothetical protein
MRYSQLLFATIVLPSLGLAAPAVESPDFAYAGSFSNLAKRENLCNLKAPPVLCTPDPTVSVEETAIRAYKFYRAFIVDGDPRTMFSLIDSVYKVIFIC